MQLLDDERAATLRTVVDRIIPPDDACPGGVEAGVYDFLIRNLTPGGYFPHLVPEYEAGLDALDSLAQRMFSGGFAALGNGQQDAVLIQFDSESREFFRMLVEQAQEGFYTSAAGQAMIGWKVTG